MFLFRVEESLAKGLELVAVAVIALAASRQVAGRQGHRIAEPEISLGLFQGEHPYILVTPHGRGFRQNRPDAESMRRGLFQILRGLGRSLNGNRFPRIEGHKGRCEVTIICLEQDAATAVSRVLQQVHCVDIVAAHDKLRTFEQFERETLAFFHGNLGLKRFHLSAVGGKPDGKRIRAGNQGGRDAQAHDHHLAFARRDLDGEQRNGRLHPVGIFHVRNDPLGLVGNIAYFKGDVMNLARLEVKIAGHHAGIKKILCLQGDGQSQCTPKNKKGSEDPVHLDFNIHVSTKHMLFVTVGHQNPGVLSGHRMLDVQDKPHRRSRIDSFSIDGNHLDRISGGVEQADAHFGTDSPFAGILDVDFQLYNVIFLLQLHLRKLEIHLAGFADMGNHLDGIPHDSLDGNPALWLGGIGLDALHHDYAPVSPVQGIALRNRNLEINHPGFIGLQADHERAHLHPAGIGPGQCARLVIETFAPRHVPVIDLVQPHRLHQVRCVLDLNATDVAVAR